MQFTVFALSGLATAALATSIPSAASQFKPFEISELNITRAAGDEGVATVLFKVNEPNSNDTTYCSGDAVRPNEINFCNGLPQFVFGDDFATLGVSWLWPNGFQGKYGGASGTGKVDSAAASFTIQPTLII